MNRDGFEHVVRAAADLVGEDEIVVIGSQSILGVYPEASAGLLMSMEADLYPRRSPEKAIEIDGTLGDGSEFHAWNGYYAHGVGPETMVGPIGWEDRMIVVEVAARVGQDEMVKAYCPEIHDLVLAKCAANRDRDWDFAREALAAGLATKEELIDRAVDLPLPEERVHSIRASLASL